MSNLINPSSIIFINTDLSNSVLNTIQLQLSITKTYLNADEFDMNVANDGYFIPDIYANGERILVLRQLYDYTNRNLADLVLFYKNGLISVENSKVGPPGFTSSLDRLLIIDLIKKSSPQFTYFCGKYCPCEKSFSHCRCNFECRKIFCRYPFS